MLLTTMGICHCQSKHSDAAVIKKSVTAEIHLVLNFEAKANEKSYLKGKTK